MIAAENMSKYYGRSPALEDISFIIPDGVIHGLIGYNGSGKTTLLKTIAGIYRPERGLIRIDGVPVFEHEEVKRKLFMLTEELYFLPQATMNSMRRFYKGYYPHWRDKTFQHLVDIFALNPANKIHTFSKGMQRQAGIVLALSCAPRFLLLDEAFDGLDLAKRRLMEKLIARYVREKQATVLISSHNLRELEGLVDQVGLIKDRRLQLSFSISSGQQQRYRCYFTYSGQPEAGLRQRLNLRDLRFEEGRFVCFAAGEAAVLRSRLREAGATNIRLERVTLEEILLTEKEPDVDAIPDLF